MVGVWQPQVMGSYSVSRAVLVVRISPPLAGASDYYVFAEREDNSDIFYEDSQVVNVSEFIVLCLSLFLVLFFPYTRTHVGTL